MWTVSPFLGKFLPSPAEIDWPVSKSLFERNVFGQGQRGWKAHFDGNTHFDSC
jgi:hypothetical protein